MKKTLVFDMDGTIANLYGVENWLQLLRDYDSLPYRKAAPLFNMEIINHALIELKRQGWKIAVVSWGSKKSNRAYDKRVRSAKEYWLKKQGFPYDELHVIQYGKSKSKVMKQAGGIQILIDDDKKVRKEWSNGFAISEKELPELLMRLLF